MKTQAIISTNPDKKVSRLVTPPSLIVTVISVYVLSYYTEVYALSWTSTPTLQAQEIYSDNIQLRSNNKQSAFVTSVNPGISITGQSPLSSLNFNYRLQSLYNAGGNNGLDIFNQLQSNSRTTFIPNKLFLNSNTSISQQNINNNLIGASNVNGSGNSSNVYTFGLSPYWTPRFGNYANGALQVNFNTVATDAGSSSNNGLNTLSDSVNLAETINLNSGAYFQRVNWNLSFNNNENYRINSPNVKFQTSNARVGIPINSYFNVFAQGGYSKNDFQSTTGSNNSGFFYTAGGQWRPSQRFSVTAGAGNNSFASVYISPIQRLNWTTTYTDNSVGTNLGQFSGGGSGFNSGINSGGNFGQGSGINSGGNFGQGSGINGGGNFGQSWQTALNYQTRRSTWSITRINNTTTAQQILAQNQTFPAQNQTFPAQNQLGNPDLNPRITNNPSFTDDVIVTKTWNFSVSFNTGKSTLSANAFDQNYKSQTSGNNQKIIGVSGTWNWQFANKTSSYIRPQWQHNDNQGSANNSQFYTVAIGMNRTITSQLNGILEFRHANQTSSGNAGNFLPGNGFSDGYEENRVTASLFMRF